MRLIQESRELEALAAALGREPLIGADTEAAGFHRYRDTICLMQISTREETVVVDTLVIPRLGELTRVLRDPGIEVIFHDADFDLRLLQRDFGVGVRGLFDTKVAAQFLGEPAIGLASLLLKYLNVSLEKKYQRADWARRPLPPDMLAYAAEDTRHLPALRDLLRERLRATDRLAWAEEEFRLLEEVRWQEPDSAAFLRMKGIRDLQPRQLATLRELYDWREDEAESRDVAPFRVLSNEALIAIARERPDSPAALRRIREIPTTLADRWQSPLLQAVETAEALAEEQLPHRARRGSRPPYDPELEARVDRLRKQRDAAAKELGLDRGFLMPRAQLEAVGRAMPRTTDELVELPGTRRWQVEALGERLLDALDEDHGRAAS